MQNLSVSAMKLSILKNIKLSSNPYICSHTVNDMKLRPGLDGFQLPRVCGAYVSPFISNSKLRGVSEFGFHVEGKVGKLHEAPLR